jgi:hypothetical protein
MPPLPPAKSKARLSTAARLGLALTAVVLAAVYGIAAWIDPFDAAGQPLTLGAHEQLGLPPCRFLQWTGRPCPTCGMTTAFSLVVHGRVVAAAKANLAGCLLALLGLPTGLFFLAAAATGRWGGPTIPEVWLVPLLGAALAFVLLAWAVRLLWG